MAQNDFAHDGQPQSTAFHTRAQHTVKALQHRIAFILRNAGAIVFNGDCNSVWRRRDPHGDMAAALRVANGVVDQVAEHLAQQKIVAIHRRRCIGAIKTEIDAAGEGSRHPFGRGGACQRNDVQPLHGLGVLGGRFGTREGEQLIDQMRSVFRRRLQLHQCGAHFFGGR